MGTVEITAESVVVATETQASCELTGEVVILGLATGSYYGLDGVGPRVWELVQEPKSVREICETLLAEYEVEAKECMNDLLGVLQHMRRERLIKVCDAVAG